MEDVSIFDCADCGQRYIMRAVQHDTFVTGDVKCACGAKLGSWHGTTSREFTALDELPPT